MRIKTIITIEDRSDLSDSLSLALSLASKGFTVSLEAKGEVMEDILGSVSDQQGEVLYDIINVPFVPPPSPKKKYLDSSISI